MAEQNADPAAAVSSKSKTTVLLLCILVRHSYFSLLSSPFTLLSSFWAVWACTGSTSARYNSGHFLIISGGSGADGRPGPELARD